MSSFIKKMNTKPLEMVQEFLSTEKKDNQCHQPSIKDDKMIKGYLTKCNTTNQDMCCPNPWPVKHCEESCFLDFSPCDGGRCIPGSWIADGWPDCLDGQDEHHHGSGEHSLPEQLVCVQCAGVVLSAGFVCRESNQGLTNKCLHETMGRNGACNDCVAYYLNLPD